MILEAYSHELSSEMTVTQISRCTVCIVKFSVTRARCHDGTEGMAEGRHVEKVFSINKPERRGVACKRAEFITPRKESRAGQVGIVTKLEFAFLRGGDVSIGEQNDSFNVFGSHSFARVYYVAPGRSLA